MAAYTDGYLSVAGTDLSSFVQQLDISEGAETNDDTVMGDTYRTAEGALFTRVVSATLKQSYASGGPHETLKGLKGTTVTVITGTSTTPSATEPHDSQSMVVTVYDRQFGSVGDLEQCRVSFVAAGDVSEVTS